MKKAINILCIVLCIVLPLMVAGCAGTETRSSTGEYLDDSVITAKVKANLTAEAATSIFKISVETFRGVVQLSGFVSSQEEIDKAEEIARKTNGVKDVENDLIIKAE